MLMLSNIIEPMSYTWKRILGLSEPFPAEHRQNFIHLFFDIAWWGVLNGSVIVFLAVYASRLGASSFQIGILTASPALINILMTFPTNVLVRGKSTFQVLRRAALFTRLFYALFIPLPILLPAQTQIWAIILITLLMNIPGTIAAVMGNAFLAEAIPDEWRGQVIGIRNALLALTSMTTSFLVGQILKTFPFEIGYMIVFALGWLGSMLSAYHLYHIKAVTPSIEESPKPLEKPTFKEIVRPDVFSGPFRSVLWIMFFFHVAVFLPNPIFPLYQVNELKLTDETIGFGTSLFWIIYFLSSTQVGSLSRKYGFKTLTGAGTVIASLATLLFTFSYQVWIYVITQIVSGIGWAINGGGLVNYLLTKVPADDRPSYLAWFNLAVNFAVLICGLVASLITSNFGLFGSMILSVIVRFLAGIAILRWG